MAKDRSPQTSSDSLRPIYMISVCSVECRQRLIGQAGCALADRNLPRYEDRYKYDFDLVSSLAAASPRAAETDLFLEDRICWTCGVSLPPTATFLDEVPGS
jgi:hypothetical protein